MTETAKPCARCGMPPAALIHRHRPGNANTHEYARRLPDPGELLTRARTWGDPAWRGHDGTLCPRCGSDNTVQTGPDRSMLCANCGHETSP